MYFCGIICLLKVIIEWVINKNKMKEKIRAFGLAIVTITVSFGGWTLLHRAIVNPGIADWIIPGIFFSLTFVFWILSVILLKKANYLWILYFFSLMPSFFFTFEFWHLLAIGTSLVLLFWASVRINRELGAAVKVNLWRSVRLGRVIMVLSLALAISSQYYFEIQKSGVHRKIPQFNIGTSNGKIISKITSIFYPGVDISKDQTITVDQLIMQSQQSSGEYTFDDQGEVNTRGDVEKMIEEQLGVNIPDDQKQELINSYYAQNQALSEKNNELILLEGRKQISDLVGMEVRGDEKVADIFSQMINKKIEDFLNFNVDSDSKGDLAYLPIVLTIILFLSVLSLGSFLAPLWVLCAQIFFWLMVKMKWVKISKVMVEQEIIE
jgi:hypothetical protein